MRIIKPFIVVEDFDSTIMLRKLERAIRTCYKSEGLITGDSAERIIKKVIEGGHHSTLEHEKITVRIICDRGVSHELVRHRIASYSQESTRYCNYANDRFGNELTFIAPCFWPVDSLKYKVWVRTLRNIEESYMVLTNDGAAPEQARSILPNSLKTEVVTTFNLREWMHFFKLRCSPRAHPQMRQVAIAILYYFRENGLALLFDDIYINESGGGTHNVNELAKVYSESKFDALPENNLKANDDE